MDYRLPTWLLLALALFFVVSYNSVEVAADHGVFKMPIALRLLLHFGCCGSVGGVVGGLLAILVKRKNHLVLYGIVAGLIIGAKAFLL
jgi:hypothetical protein